MAAAVENRGEHRTALPPPVGGGGGGGGATPTWLVGVPTMTWRQIPGTALSSALPAGNPSGAVNGSPSGIMSFSGACIKRVGSQIWLAGGGHSDYSGNEPYSVRLQDDSPIWVRRRNPSAVRAGSAYYADGRPIARHTCFDLQYDDLRDLFFMMGSNNWYPDGNGAGPQVDSFNPSTNDWATAGTWPNGPSGFHGDNVGNGACKDDQGNWYWYGHDNNTIYKWTRSTATWSNLITSASNVAYLGSMVHDALNNRLVSFTSVYGGSGNNPALWVNLSGGAPTQHTNAWIGSQAAQMGGTSSPTWCESRNTIMVMNWGSNIIYEVDPTTFAATTLSVSGSPTSTIPNNTDDVCGRFAYAPELNLLYYLPTTDSNIWYVKLP